MRHWRHKQKQKNPTCTRRALECTRLLTIIGLKGIPLVKKGDDLSELIVSAARQQGVTLENADILVVTQKIVSKAEGRVLRMTDVVPSEFAENIAVMTERDPSHVEFILQESLRVVRMKDRHLIMETKQGFVCANAGVDRSNVTGTDEVALLPTDADMSADRIRSGIEKRLGVRLAVIVTDTWGRPWRLGQVNFAIGVAGMNPMKDYRGTTDMFGYQLRVTTIAVADELAAAGELVMNKVDAIPVAVVKGYSYPHGAGSGKDLIRPAESDLFR